MGSIITLGAVGVGLSLVMVGAWVAASKPGRASWSDPIWSWSTGLAGIIVALSPHWEAAGHRPWLIVTLVVLWSLRFGANVTLARSGNAANPRHGELRRLWGKSWEMRLFLCLQVQALASWLIMFAIWGGVRDPAPFPAWTDFAGSALLLASILGGAVSQSQIDAFFAVRNNDGKVCTKGLWGLSRHPDYFFQWLGWVAFLFFAVGEDGVIGLEWLAFASPVLVYVLLVHAIGIPPLESHMERARGDLYRDVQNRIPKFWPIPGLRG